MSKDFNNYSEQEDSSDTSEKERQEIPRWLRWTCTAAGAVMILSAFILVFLHAFERNKYPSPSELEADVLIGFGFALILVMNFPWTKIRVGDVEVERAIQGQMDSYGKENAKLTSVIVDLEQQLRDLSPDKGEAVKVLGEVAKLRSEHVAKDNLIESFLKAWPTWGFTPNRIRIWGGEQKGFNELAEMDVPAIRASANRLVNQGKAKTRISSRGSILYQTA
jgi:hypothetical protein